MDILSGYKSYATAAAAGVALTLVQLGVLTQDQANQVLSVLAILFGVFMRMAVAKAAQTTQLATSVVKPEVAQAIADGAVIVPSGKPAAK